MSERQPAASQLAAIERFIDLSSRYTRDQLYFLQLSEGFAGKPEQKQMDDLVTQTIEENVTVLSTALQELSKLQTITVNRPDGGASAEIQGLGYSTESHCYQALVHDGADRWPVLAGNQLSLRAKPDQNQTK